MFAFWITLYTALDAVDATTSVTVTLAIIDPNLALFTLDSATLST